MRTTVCIITLVLLTISAFAQNLAPSLDKWQIGGDAGLQPDWELGKDLLFEQKDGQGRRLLGVRGRGDDSAFWRSPDLKLQAGQAYLFSFKVTGKGSGTVICGPEQVNYDFGCPDGPRTLSFAFRAPDMDKESFLRLGQWHMNGEALFDQPELYTASVVHSQWGNLVLGEGEKISGEDYTDVHAPGWRGTTIHRTLFSQSTYFNTNRLVFSPGGEVIYRESLPFDMLSGRVRANICYHTGGKLLVSISRDGKSWTAMGEHSGSGSFEKAVPKEFFPARELYVRMQPAGEDAYLQVDSYTFTAKVKRQPETRSGDTMIVPEKQVSGDIGFRWIRTADGFRLRCQNRTGTPQRVLFEAYIAGKSIPVNTVNVPAKGESLLDLKLPRLSAGLHRLTFKAKRGREVLYDAYTELTRTVIEASDYGYRLASAVKDVDLWWCEGAWKVGEGRAVPDGPVSPALRLEAARGEYEPAQIVLKPRKAGLVLSKAWMSDLKSGKSVVPSSAAKFLEVATVHIVKPTDYLGREGNYPDPLPVLKAPFSLKAGKNQAIWLLVHVPETAKAGSFSGNVYLQTNHGKITVPVKLRVFNFALPKASHLRSAFGINPDNIRAYHHLKMPEQERKVWDMYMRSFADHRISPFTFNASAIVKTSFTGEGNEKRVHLDFTEFDKYAGECLDKLGFNSFLLPISGLGWGTFFEKHEGEFGGFKQGTPDYERLMGDYLRQLESHLREKGWLEKAYTYWYDEPEPKDYPFVIEGMKLIRKYAPGIKRLLTKQPEPDLIGHVDIWCGLTPVWSPKLVEERRKAGEEVWWYICCIPKAPYIGEFIEHPATEMRLWPWQSWQYGVQGILVWQTNYWTSPAAYPREMQDPWKDPMSWVSGYGITPGTKQYWDNGDGRYLYPPRRDPNKPQPPAIEPPTVSIRWENLRDGMEDYEYFHLLKQHIERLRGKADAGLLKKAESLLTIPPHISKDLTTFTYDPRPLLEHRRKVAEMVERLQGIR